MLARMRPIPPTWRRSPAAAGSSEKLLPTLTDTQRETFEKYVDAEDEANKHRPLRRLRLRLSAGHAPGEGGHSGEDFL